MQFLLEFHGELRWLVLLAALIAGGRSLLGWMRGSDFGKADRILMSVLTGLLDVNLLLGLILLFTYPGGLAAYRLEHAVTMILAVAAAHTSAAWRKSVDSTRKFRNNFLVVVAVLVLVLTGVIRLRGGFLF
jgi:predicted Na+-dependent transporter